LGLPIVANSGLGDTDAILRETKSGVVLKHFTQSEYQRLAEEILQFEKGKEQTREAAKQYFTLESGIEKYDSIYKNL